MNSKISVLLLVFILFSCGKSNSEALSSTAGTGSLTITSDSFPEVIDLNTEADSIEIPPVLLMTRALVSSNDLIIAHDVGDKDTLFRVFSVKNGKYLGGFGYTGAGPLDFEFQPVLPTSVIMRGDTLQASDLKTHRSFLTDAKAILEDGKLDESDVLFLNRVAFPKDLTPLNSAVNFGNSVLYGKKDMDVDKQLYAYDLKSEKLKQIIDFPDFRPAVPPTANGTLYMNDYILSTDGMNAVFAYRNFPVVRIYNLKDSAYLEIEFKGKNEQLNNIETYPGERAIIDTDMHRYYGSVNLTDKKIYASYHEYQDVVENGERRTEWVKKYREIHVFDLSGKPMQKIILPWPVLRFTVTPDDKRLYFVKPDVEDQLFYYQLR